MKYFLYSLFALVALSSCRVSDYAMRSPNYRIDFEGDDFEFSEQLVSEATSVRVLLVDWNRLFKWSGGSARSDRFGDNFDNQKYNGSVGSSVTLDVAEHPLLGFFSIPNIPVIGNNQKGRMSAYALYNLMQENPGYDFVIYPQFKTERFFIPLFYSKRKVEVTARLGKIRSE